MNGSKFKLFILILWFISLLACTNTGKNEKINSSPTSNKTTTELLRKYNGKQFDADFGLLNYTIINQEKYTNQVYVHNANIQDIYNKNNKTYIKLDDMQNKFILECPQVLIQSLLKNTTPYEDISFVMKINNVRNIDFAISGENEDSGVVIDLESSNTQIYEGILMDYRKEGKIGDNKDE